MKNKKGIYRLKIISVFFLLRNLFSDLSLKLKAILLVINLIYIEKLKLKDCIHILSYSCFYFSENFIYSKNYSGIYFMKINKY